MSNLLSKDEVNVLMDAISDGEIPGGQALAGKNRRRRATDIRPYNFRRPVTVLSEQLKALNSIHETFARSYGQSLSGYLRAEVKVRCLSVDQIAYREFIEALPEPCTLANLHFGPHEEPALLAISPGLCMAFVDRVMGGSGANADANQPLTELEHFVIEEAVGLALKDLTPAWSRLTPVNFGCDGIDYAKQFVHIATEEDSVVSVSLEISFGKARGVLTLCYTLKALKPVLEQLTARPHTEDESKPASTVNPASIQAALNLVPLKLTARLGSASLTMQDITELKAGDVFMLNKEIDTPADLDVAGTTKFRGYFGVHHGKLAVLISKRLG